MITLQQDKGALAIDLSGNFLNQIVAFLKSS
jgi:hypothetical protein